jgi:hypothetical protein
MLDDVQSGHDRSENRADDPEPGDGRQVLFVFFSNVDGLVQKRPVLFQA